jgi:hypothetical protein
VYIPSVDGFQRVDVYILCAEAECKTGCQYKKNNPLAFHLVWQVLRLLLHWVLWVSRY